MSTFLPALLLLQMQGSAAAPATTIRPPFRFEPNVGQVRAPGADFISRAPGYAVRLNARGARVRSGGNTLQLRLDGANPRAVAKARHELPGRSHYLTGADMRAWRTDVPAFARVEYHNIYSGIDIAYYGNPAQQLEYDFLVHPGRDPGVIQVRYEGAREVHVEASGELVVRSEGGELRQPKPYIYQLHGGARTAVPGRYVMRGPSRVGFEVANYDRTRPLVIDPVISYSTYLGGGGLDTAAGIALDAGGNVYLAGWTDSADFPLANPRQGYAGGVDAFVTKLSPAGTVIYSTYLGGAGDDRAFGIAVDASGCVLVTGWTYSGNFPLASPLQWSLAGGRDAFLAKLNAGGNGLVFSTYLGGGGYDSGNAVALDGQGNAYVAGDTTSPAFPVFNASQVSSRGGQEAFAAKVSASGALLYSTYFGGYGSDRALAVAVDGAGAAYLAGSTDSTDLPVLSAFQSAHAGGQDAFVAKLSPGGNALLYSTYLGGSGGTGDQPEAATAVIVDASGNAHIAGVTSSYNFPLVNAHRGALTGIGRDAFVAKLNPQGNALVYSSYIGGAAMDVATGIALDQTGTAYVAGYTASADFPALFAVQPSNNGLYDAFVVGVPANGGPLAFATLLGGKGSDSANALAVDAAGNIHLAGQTLSHDFPLIQAVQTVNGGGASAFAARIGIGQCPVTLAPAGPLTVPSWGASQSVSIVTAPACGWMATAPVNWIALSGAISGAGNGTVSLAVLPNAGAVSRSAVVTIGGVPLQIHQRSPAGDNEAYVRFLYADLLGRGATNEDVALWANSITSGAASWAQVGLAFFNSPEFGESAAYVVKAYLGVLFRDPDFAGWKQWLTFLRLGQTQMALLNAFLESPEYQAKFGHLATQPDSIFITFLYENMLGRAPDPAGLSYWTQALASGVTRPQAIYTFLTSAEYQQRVQIRMHTLLLYMGFLLRAPDASGLAAWMQYLAAYPLLDAIHGFVTSAEYRARF